MAIRQPSYTRYAKANKNVVGINWDKVNEDRRQLGNKEIEKKTVIKK